MTKYLNCSIWLCQVYHEWLGGLDLGPPSLWKCLTWPHCSGMTWMTLWRTTPIHFLPGRRLCHHASYCEKATTITSIITICRDCGKNQYFSFWIPFFLIVFSFQRSNALVTCSLLLLLLLPLLLLLLRRNTLPRIHRPDCVTKPIGTKRHLCSKSSTFKIFKITEQTLQYQ